MPGVIRVRVPYDLCPCGLEFSGGPLRVFNFEQRHQAPGVVSKKAK
jgi:hypothetical protein